MDIRKAALVEIGGSHDECLYSQLLFLKRGGYHTTLICDDNMASRLGATAIADEVLCAALKDKNTLLKLAVLKRIRKYITDRQITTVIFNTAEGPDVRNMCLMPYPSSTNFYGTMHNLHKVSGSSTQKVISRRIRNYFVLNDYLVDNIKAIPHRGLSFASYYPIFFPEYGDVALPARKEGELWVAIPGQVEYKRRDYKTLVKVISSMSELPLIKFFLLGKSMHAHGDGAALKQLLKKNGLEDMFMLWDDFVDNATYHTFIRNCDVVMPLLHPGNEGYEGYLNLQISGAYNAAFAYKKPLLMYADFEQYADFRENAVFYNLESLGDTLLTLPGLLAQGHLYQDKKWTIEQQADRYLSFIRR